MIQIINNQSVNNQTKEYNLKKAFQNEQAEIFFISSWSEETLFFNLNFYIKIHQFVRKNTQTAGVNRAKKAYQCIIYTPMRSPIVSNPRVHL